MKVEPALLGLIDPLDGALLQQPVRGEQVNFLERTVNGIGERAGNASLEEVVMALKVRADRLPFENQIDTQQIYSTSQLLSLSSKVARVTRVSNRMSRRRS